nr:hypothetical protein [Tanacetum cinerariifolium]
LGQIVAGIPGHPISTFALFEYTKSETYAVEALNVILIDVKSKHLFRGTDVGKDKVNVSHLQFSDDALTIGEWSKKNINNLSRILTCFHLASGLKAFLLKLICLEVLTGFPSLNSFRKDSHHGKQSSNLLVDALLYQNPSLEVLGFTISPPLKLLKWRFLLESQPNCRVCDRVLTILTATSTSCYVQCGDGPYNGPQLEFIGLHTSYVGPSGLPRIFFSWAWSRLPRSPADLNDLLELEILISNLIPAKVNLDLRGIDVHLVRCSICDEDLETEEHLLEKHILLFLLPKSQSGICAAAPGTHVDQEKEPRGDVSSSPPPPRMAIIPPINVHSDLEVTYTAQARDMYSEEVCEVARKLLISHKKNGGNVTNKGNGKPQELAFLEPENVEATLDVIRHGGTGEMLGRRVNSKRDFGGKIGCYCYDQGKGFGILAVSALLDTILKDRFPRAYALESCKTITVGSKLVQPNLTYSFRRTPRGGAEQTQTDELAALMHPVTLAPISDRWTWTLNSSGEFSVASVRNLIDVKILLECEGEGEHKTRWIRYVPIKVNTHAWK